MNISDEPVDNTEKMCIFAKSIPVHPASRQKNKVYNKKQTITAMNKIIFSILLLLTILSTTRAYAMETPPPVGDSSCTYTLYLTDYGGDGWNGASVRITDLTTEEYTDFTIDLNGWVFSDVINETDTFNVIDGHQYSLSWNSGQYDYECSFSLRDNLGELVYEYDPYSYDPWGGHLLLEQHYLPLQPCVPTPCAPDPPICVWSAIHHTLQHYNGQWMTPAFIATNCYMGQVKIQIVWIWLLRTTLHIH